jgi:DNA polymerase-3 subunit beta
MKLSVLQENLAWGLTTASRSVATKAQLPVLGNVLLATDQGRLKLSATNLETGINLWLGAKIEHQGAISIPAKILSEYVASLPAEKIDLEIKENLLYLNCGNYQASFIGLPAGEFPNVPSLKGKPEISLTFKDLALAISQVAFAAAQDEGRPVLTGVLMQTKGENLILVATDGYRLSLKKLGGLPGIQKVVEFQKGLLIPARTLMEVGKIISIGEGEKILGLTVTPEENQVIFTTPDCEIVSRLIEGKFPDFEKILPEKGTTRITLDTQSLAMAVRIAAIFARESANIIKWKMENARLPAGQGKLKISANAAQVGDNVSEIEVKLEGKGNSIAFNSRYLLDFLASVNSDLLNFEMTTPLNPGVFTPTGDKSYLHIIMPVRVQE